MSDPGGRPDIERVREIAEGVLERARNDDGYRSELLVDPVAVLMAAGLDEQAAQRIGLEEWHDGVADVAGHMIAKPRPGPMTCDGFTCWVTWCGLVPATNV